MQLGRRTPAVMALAVAVYASFILPGKRASVAWAASDPCASSLSQCPSNGCAQKGTPDALVNEQKRRIPTGGTATFLTFEQFAELQQVVDDKGIPQGRGSKLTKTGRKKLKSLSLDGGVEVGEGDLVELTGFIARKRKLDWAGAESVNCRLPDDADNDIHIPMVEDPNGSEYNSVVVEPIRRHASPSGLSRTSSACRSSTSSCSSVVSSSTTTSTACTTTLTTMTA